MFLQERFLEAMKMVGKEFEGRVHDYAQVWLPARSIVEAALKHRFDVRFHFYTQFKLPHFGFRF